MTSPYDTSVNTFAGSSGHFSPESSQRKRLQLKPRSSKEGTAPRRRERARSAKGDPFGNAVPREQVLKSRGVDVATMDEAIEKKASVSHFTTDQEAEVEAVRVALTKAEKELRAANEKELPEESYRVEVDKRRKELNEVMEKFASSSIGGPETGHSSRSLERSEQHARPRHSARERSHQVQDRDDDAAFASFNSVRRRRQERY